MNKKKKVVKLSEWPFWLPGMTLEEVKTNAVLQALRHHGFNITHTAKTLGLSLRGLRLNIRKWEKQYGVK